MAAWRASKTTMTRLFVAFLSFNSVLGIKVSITGAKHVCVSGSQVLHVNFGATPLEQCGPLNTTPQASKEEHRADDKKANEQAKAAAFQGSYLEQFDSFTNVGLRSRQRDKFVRSLKTVNLYL